MGLEQFIVAFPSLYPNYLTIVGRWLSDMANVCIHKVTSRTCRRTTFVYSSLAANSLAVPDRRRVCSGGRTPCKQLRISWAILQRGVNETLHPDALGTAAVEGIYEGHPEISAETRVTLGICSDAHHSDQ